MPVSPNPPDAERATSFFAFWLLAAVVLVVLAVATLVAVHNGNRLGAVFLALGAACAGVAWVVRRAARNLGREARR